MQVTLIGDMSWTKNGGNSLPFAVRNTKYPGCLDKKGDITLSYHCGCVTWHDISVINSSLAPRGSTVEFSNLSWWLTKVNFALVVIVWRYELEERRGQSVVFLWDENRVESSIYIIMADRQIMITYRVVLQFKMFLPATRTRQAGQLVNICVTRHKIGNILTYLPIQIIFK